MKAEEDVITIEPTMTGDHGRAWLVDMEKLRGGAPPEDDATVALWLVEAPWAHPAWHSYRIVVVHLRPMPDNRPTHKYLEGATHEIWVEALNPDKPRQESLDGDGFAPLAPLNYASQFREPGGDSQAAARVAFAVKMICAGRLSPDTDFRRDWITRFGSNMMKG